MEVLEIVNGFLVINNEEYVVFCPDLNAVNDELGALFLDKPPEPRETAGEELVSAEEQDVGEDL